MSNNNIAFRRKSGIQRFAAGNSTSSWPNSIQERSRLRQSPPIYFIMTVNSWMANSTYKNSSNVRVLSGRNRVNAFLKYLPATEHLLTAGYHLKRTDEAIIIKMFGPNCVFDKRRELPPYPIHSGATVAPSKLFCHDREDLEPTRRTRTIPKTKNDLYETGLFWLVDKETADYYQAKYEYSQELMANQNHDMQP